MFVYCIAKLKTWRREPAMKRVPETEKGIAAQTQRSIKSTLHTMAYARTEMRRETAQKVASDMAIE